jgi:hypothetical protein
VSSYHSIATRIKVKAEAPAELIALLDNLFSWTTENNDSLNPDWHDLKIGLGNSACYLPSTAPKKEAIEGGWMYSHIGSSRSDRADEMIKFLRAHQEWIIADKFDIVWRAVYEDAWGETAIYFTGKTFVEGYGFVFDDPMNAVGCAVEVDHLHPDHCETPGSDYEEFDTHGYETLPWNYKEILKLNVQKGKKPMGTYVGIATRLKIKKTADAGSLEFLQAVYGDREDDFGQDRQGQIQPLLNALLGQSGLAYFPNWIWSYAKDCGDHFLLESRASTKENNIPHNFMMLLQDQRDDFILEKGDIILRQASEEHPTETIVYFDGEKLVEGTGYVHGYGDLPALAHPSHPRNFVTNYLADPEEEAVNEAAAIPWNYEQIQKLNEESYAEYLEELCHNSFGGGGR